MRPGVGRKVSTEMGQILRLAEKAGPARILAARAVTGAPGILVCGATAELEPNQAAALPEELGVIQGVLTVLPVQLLVVAAAVARDQNLPAIPGARAQTGRS